MAATTATTAITSKNNVPKWKVSGDWFDVANAIYHVLVSLPKLRLVKTLMVFWHIISKKETMVMFTLIA
jgi:hypothetical protein